MAHWILKGPTDLLRDEASRARKLLGESLDSGYADYHYQKCLLDQFQRCQEAADKLGDGPRPRQKDLALAENRIETKP